ncbi:hypothetical protein K7I13_05975 [Brucepastera parasyntrophica]|uniref:hypothetical protein n=1 Tax=Brucepastera parasyntrophica TaxID=2880008 RepID=UPI00210C99C3|nr:hypothetical protein [Brucepastera parasyntrophica]ULQ60811.1 hypothetical protein K7I13_05975 [Brucepastera parasyntrophica]
MNELANINTPEPPRSSSDRLRDCVLSAFPELEAITMPDDSMQEWGIHRGDILLYKPVEGECGLDIYVYTHNRRVYVSELEFDHETNRIAATTYREGAGKRTEIICPNTLPEYSAGENRIHIIGCVIWVIKNNMTSFNKLFYNYKSFFECYEN